MYLNFKLTQNDTNYIKIILNINYVIIFIQKINKVVFQEFWYNLDKLWVL